MILWCQCAILIEYKDNTTDYTIDYANDNTTDSESFKFKSKLTNNTSKAGTVNAQVAAPLKYLSSLCKLLKYP